MILNDARRFLFSFSTFPPKATRLNWYRDSNEWKPFHHDAAAVKPDKAKTQNFTVAVSFGMERDAAFEHAQTKTVILAHCYCPIRQKNTWRRQEGKESVVKL